MLDCHLRNQKEEVLTKHEHIRAKIIENMDNNMGTKCNYTSNDTSSQFSIDNMSKPNNSKTSMPLRRGPRHRKAANVCRSSSTASTELQVKRPLSMSCLLATNLDNPYMHSVNAIYQSPSISETFPTHHVVSQPIGTYPKSFER